jgi:hypothetical protein
MLEMHGKVFCWNSSVTIYSRDDAPASDLYRTFYRDFSVDPTNYPQHPIETRRNLGFWLFPYS